MIRHMFGPQVDLGCNATMLPQNKNVLTEFIMAPKHLFYQPMATFLVGNAVYQKLLAYAISYIRKLVNFWVWHAYFLIYFIFCHSFATLINFVETILSL